MDPVIFITCLLVFIGGCFIQSTIGFGMGVLVGPFILLLEPRLMPCAIIFIGMFMSAIVWYQYRHALSLRFLVFAFLGRLPGIFIAAYVLMVISTDQLEIMLGITVLGAVILSFAKLRLAPTPRNLFIGGFISGITGTTTGIGGPVIALLMQNEEPEKIRANLAAFFCLTNILSLTALHFSGRFSMADFNTIVWLLPAPIIASLLAYRVRNKVKKQVMQYGVLGLCSLSAVVALSQGFHLFN
ncbi:sulfite exporter TauE/SafE family protein [Photobacterium piscicola]|uniref:Probable membrane transporter protein n=1 Tax=Photobacterium piscicola TaxID=1378299 RepID=A0ABU6LCY3_9GAMM|nr:sulfite exporter TauE/SafE family protein [Photobacterium piscicola]MEC6881060.1 sulfite exporter TauE/SafE family protein [Photobacterium piscicola]MEC6897426.1 sulfite exporter TauE/SafE family protein [Photobacterium piscicola]